jgi:hypothetical protein
VQCQNNQTTNALSLIGEITALPYFHGSAWKWKDFMVYKFEILSSTCIGVTRLKAYIFVFRCSHCILLQSASKGFLMSNMFEGSSTRIPYYGWPLHFVESSMWHAQW